MATSPKTTTSKTTSTKATASDVTPADGAEGEPKPEQLKSKDLIAAIAPTITVKRKDIRVVLDAALKAMGQALADGKVLNLPPLGRLEVKRVREGERADSLVVRVRRVKPGAAKPAAATALADSDD